MIMSIPTGMASARSWVCWRLEPDPQGGRPRKVPYSPRTGRRASPSDPDTWGTLQEAAGARKRWQYTGVGYVFTEACGIVGVDIDHCLDEKGRLNECAAEITKRYPTYTEISPSGAGLHLYYRGAMPGRANRNSGTGVEMYATARYFTVTGKRLPGSPEDIRDGAEALAWIHRTYIAPPAREKSSAPARTRAAPLTDERLLEKARAAANGEAFEALWSGRWQGKYGSQSEADLALCCMLMFWSGKDETQADRLFRRSGLYRPKWDERRDASGATYGHKTLAAAAERTEQVYSPGASPGGERAILVSGGRYMRVRGQECCPLTNFTVEPVELLRTDTETQLTCDMVTDTGQRFRQVLMTADFSSAQKFRAALNRQTIALGFTGNENDLETLKLYLSGLKWKVKRGVNASGLYEADGRWIFVDRGGAFSAGGKPAEGVVQLDRCAVLESGVPESPPAAAEDLLRLGPLLLGYNEPAKTVTVLAWTCGCFLKEQLRLSGVKFPHLYLIGEAGSGKSTTLERVIRPLCGRRRVVGCPQVTGFTLMKESAGSNLFPQLLDEYKPGRMDKTRTETLSGHLRDSYDGHEGVRGRADQTQVSYQLLAPLAMAGEEAPEEPSLRERGMELVFSKLDLRAEGRAEAARKLAEEERTLTRLGRLLLDTALELGRDTARYWHTEELKRFNPALPARVTANLACCMAGLRLLEMAAGRLGLTWEQVFPFTADQCAGWLEFGVSEYLMNGRTDTVTVVEQALEIMDRMGLTNDECRFLGDGTVAIYFKGCYDRFTRYIRENAITAEYLQYSQFMRQLKRSSMYVDTRSVRFADGNVKSATVLDYNVIRERCDVDALIRRPFTRA